MRTLISLLLILLSFSVYSQDICVPEHIIRNSLKEHEKYIFLKAELKLKDSLLIISYQRIEDKEQVVKTLKLEKKDYEDIIGKLREEGLIKDGQIAGLEKKNKKKTGIIIIMGIVILIQLVTHG